MQHYFFGNELDNAEDKVDDTPAVVMEDGENEGEDAPKTDENGESKPEPKNSQDAKVEPAPEEKKDDEAN